jgi:hypothetical protein
MKMRSYNAIVALLLFLSCTVDKKSVERAQAEVSSLGLANGEITLCGSGEEQFGKVSFENTCTDKVQGDIDLAVALLHSFEYIEAEKVFARVITADPNCLAAYWGVAMSNFHPLWAPPGPAELAKGSQIVKIGRSIAGDAKSREADYLEAIARIYDNWERADHRIRMMAFKDAMKDLRQKYPEDIEAAIFYALALNASADPADKTFQNQREAGKILEGIFSTYPDHPGIAHYIIHTYDYPELAQEGLPAARKYASIAAASAHAQHMPSHIFTRLGLWDEAVLSNLNSVSAAQCYAEQSKMDGHWDEELHGLDYLTYAYLQKGDDVSARKQVDYLKTITKVVPVNFKDAYCFAAMPARYVIERKDWRSAATLQLSPNDFPWDKFLWEKANNHFARLLGNAHLDRRDSARTELNRLKEIYETLHAAGEKYKANLVLVQVKSGEAWVNVLDGKIQEAVSLMTEAASIEEATTKHPVTPGEIIPARELLGDLYLNIGDVSNALLAYEAELKKHPNKLNAIYGAVVAAGKSNDAAKAAHYKAELKRIVGSVQTDRDYLARVNM